MSLSNSSLIDPEKRFSQSELKTIEERASFMFKNDEVEVYYPVGNHEVCLKRSSRLDKKIQVYKMDSTLAMNEKLVTRFNKRKKTQNE